LRTREIKKEGTIMAETITLDKTFNAIIRRMVEKGRAPHYTELATELGVLPEEGKKALQALFFPGFPGWLAPKTDYVSSFPPFSTLPTQYRITVEGRQDWFGQ
jgi:hypothetical protein